MYNLSACSPVLMIVKIPPFPKHTQQKPAIINFKGGGDIAAKDWAKKSKVCVAKKGFLCQND
jgi:hypothetical protein